MNIPHRLQWLRLFVILAAFICLAAATAAMATEVTGRAAIWGYSRDDSVDHVQIVPMLALTLHQLGHPSLSVQTTLRGYADYRNGESNDESVRIHRALLLYKPAAKPYELRAGQQWVTEGVGRGNVLGLWAKYDVTQRADVVVYGGSRLPNSISTDGNIPNEGYSAGLNAQFRLVPKIGLSYFYVGRGNEVLYQGAGIDASCRRLQDVVLRARIHMNLEQSKLETGELSAQWQASEKLMASIMARNAAPRVFEDSFFATMLEEASTSSLRGSVRWTFFESLYTSCGGTTVFTENDQLYKVRAGLGIPELELGYTHWLAADKGDMDGFYGQGMLSPVSDFDFIAGFDYSRGSNSEIRPNTESQSAWLGGTWSPARVFALSARGEHVRDISHSEDWRALVSVSSYFSTFR